MLPQYVNHRRAGERLSPTPEAIPIDEETTPDWPSLLQVVRRRFRLLITIALVVMALVVGGTLLTPTQYTATVKMIAGGAGASSGNPAQNANDSTLPVLNALMIASGVASAETFAELIREQPVAQSVIANLHLPVSPNGLLDQVTVKPVTNTSILSLSVRWPQREQAIAIANEFGSVFVARERDLVASEANSALVFLSTELPRANKRLIAAQTALARYQQSHSLADVDSQTKDQIALLSGIDSKVAQLEVDRRQATAQIASMQRQLHSYTPMIPGQHNAAPNPITEQLKAQLAQINVQLQSARQQFTDAHPTVIALKQQQSELAREIASRPAWVTSGTVTIPNPLYQQLTQQVSILQSQVASDTAQSAALRSQRGDQDARLRALPAQTMEIARLKSEAQSASDIYGALQHKYDDATVVKTTAISNVTVTDPATVWTTSKWPNFKMNMIAGIVVSLVLAVATIFILERLDDRVRDERDLEQRLHLPILASIPRSEPETQRPLPWLRRLTAESFLQLISSMAYATDRPLRTIAISSPSQGDGKTTIASSVAIAMADLTPGILVIDADLRQPTLHEKLGIENGLGLSDVLVGVTRLEDAVAPTRYAGLDCLTSGKIPPNPIKLLQSERFADLLTAAKERYRTIIIDCPAVNPIFDSAIISAHADGFVLVVAANITDTRATKEALKRMRSTGGTNFLGVVLNMAKVDESQFSGYYFMPAPTAPTTTLPPAGASA